MSDILYPCPKCKSCNAQAVFKRKRTNSIVMCLQYTDYGIRCDDCGYEVHGYMSEKQAVRIWNFESVRNLQKDGEGLEDERNSFSI